jgi:hypothetical protein
MLLEHFHKCLEAPQDLPLGIVAFIHAIDVEVNQQ